MAFGPRGGGGGSATLSQEQIDAIVVALQGFMGAVDPKVNGGRLVVSPAYMNTAGDSAFQLNSVDKKAIFGWVQEISHVVPAISVYVTAVGVAGQLTLELYEADSNGEPAVGLGCSYDPIEITTADTWYRFLPYEEPETLPNLVPGKRYLIYATIEEGADISLSYNRQNVEIASGLVPGCWSKSTTDGGATWIDLTKDSQPALLNVIVGSTPSYHAPQLVYGWVNGKGNKVAVYNNGVWELATIPDEGVFYDFTFSTEGLVNVFVRYANNTVGLICGTNTIVFQDGIPLQIGDLSRRFVGLVNPITRG